MKRVISGILITCIILMMIPINRRVNATDVTVDGTLADVLYGYTSYDLLSIPNYLDFFEVPEDKQYLKYCAQYIRLTNNNTTEFGYEFWDDIASYWDDTSKTTGLKEVSFPAYDGYKLFYWWYTGTKYTCQTLVVNTEGEPIIINGRLCCTEQFTLYYNQYSVSTDFTTFSQYPNSSSYSGYVNGQQRGDYYYFDLDYNRQCMYSEIPYLMQYSSDELYPDGAFLAESPYYYDDFVKVVDAWYNKTDDTGFVVDRRTQHMIDPDDTSTDQIISDGFDPLLFNGSLGFNWFNSSGSTNYVSSLDTFKPFIQLKYKINNYTDIHKDDVSLVWDAELYMKLKYDSEIDGGDFITSCRYNASGKWDLVGHEDQFTLLASKESNLFTLTNVRNTSGSNPMGNEFRDTNDINQNISIGISAYKHDPDVEVMSESQLKEYINDIFHGNKGNSTDGSYGYIHFNVYLKNNVSGEQSVVYSSVFDLFNNKFSDNKTQLVNNDDTAYSDFVDSFNYLDQNGDLSLVDYAQPFDVNASGGVGYGGNGGNASIGNISIGAGEIIVDMPADEWLQHSPNFNSLLTTVKTGLTDVSEGSNSVMTLLKNTYTVFPVDVWGYLTLAIAIISGLAVVRYIRRG